MQKPSLSDSGAVSVSPAYALGGTKGRMTSDSADLYGQDRVRVINVVGPVPGSSLRTSKTRGLRTEGRGAIIGVLVNPCGSAREPLALRTTGCSSAYFVPTKQGDTASEDEGGGMER